MANEVDDLIDEIQDLAALTGSGLATDALVLVHLNSAGRDLHQIISERNSDGWHMHSVKDLTTSADTQSYSFSGLSIDVDKILRVANVKGDQLEELHMSPVDWFFNDTVGLYVPSSDGGDLCWRVFQEAIWFYPIPASGGDTIRLWYSPEYTALVAADDLPTYYPTQARDFIVAAAVATLMLKQESDAGPWVQRRKQLRRDIQHDMCIKAPGSPSRRIRQRRRYF